MSFNNGPTIVTNGLVLALDAGDKNSYPGSGTTWNDLTGVNNGTLTNGPTFDSGNGGSIVFDGVDDYADCGTDSRLTGIKDITAASWVKILLNTDSSAIVNRYYNTTQNNGWVLFGGGSGESFRFGIGGRENSTSFLNCQTEFKFYFSQWYYVTGVKEGNLWSIYVNGILENSQMLGTGTVNFSNNVTYIASYPQFPEPPNRNNNISISTVSIYNRALSDSEVLQNYNATKGRFNL